MFRTIMHVALVVGIGAFFAVLLGEVVTLSSPLPLPPPEERKRLRKLYAAMGVVLSALILSAWHLFVV